MQLDTVYGTRNDRDLHVDIYQPTGSLNHHTAVLGKGSRPVAILWLWDWFDSFARDDERLVLILVEEGGSC
jgi:hypothetical protein